MTRKRHKKSDMPFADALEAAQKRLKQAQKERDTAVRTLAGLDVEIPSLQRTSQALELQLDPSKIGQPMMPPTRPRWSPVVDVPQGEVIPLVPIAPENLTEDELLPEPEGTPVLPE